MSSLDNVISILHSILLTNGSNIELASHTQLLGEIPEFDSMSVVSVITELESRYGFTIHDDELDPAIFTTVGSLATFVDNKIAAPK